MTSLVTDGSLVLVLQRAYGGLERTGIDPGLDAERAWERTSALGRLKTVHRRVEPGPSARLSLARIGNDPNDAGLLLVLDGDDA